MTNRACKSISVLVWLVFLANSLFTPVHAIGMLESHGATDSDAVECPMHAEHAVSSGEDNCVCPDGSCTSGGADRLSPANVILSLDVTFRVDAVLPSGFVIFICKINGAGYCSRAPPDLSLF